MTFIARHAHADELQRAVASLIQADEHRTMHSIADGLAYTNGTHERNSEKCRMLEEEVARLAKLIAR